jgi:hypothetical protein
VSRGARILGPSDGDSVDLGGLGVRFVVGGEETDGRSVLIFKPRGQWHEFWNAGDEPARIFELVSPGGFENYFADLAEVFSDGLQLPGAPPAD